ncbi:hypothetical protein [Marinicrinis sediminis]|uniref:Uncharacterized protein n=1 Tax=Marinicrinis sediminis TaxID=1652465 RepID=A0ABW5RF82_9BACL
MQSVLVISGVILFFSCLLLSSRPFYRLYLKHVTRRVMKKHQMNVDELMTSFEEVIYLIPLPNNTPYIKNATIEQFYIVEDWSSWLYPELRALRVFLTNPDGPDQLIAYYSMKHFTLPSLAKLEFHHVISSEVYQKVATCRMLNPDLLAQLIQEVYTRIHKTRYGSS